MQLGKIQNAFSWVVVASEVSHVFCCVLPSAFTLITFLVGMGMIGAMPLWMNGAHEVMHAYEMPLIIISGFVLALGWALHLASSRINCHDTGCGHGPCTPKKNRSFFVLKIASLLFVVNVSIYVIFHVQAGQYAHSDAIHMEQDHDEHGHHGHHDH